MRASEDERVPFFTAVPEQTPTATSPYSKDEENYDTLLAVRKILAASADDLKKDFNMLNIDITQLATDMVYAQSMARQIGAKQEAYAIIAPLLESVESAIQTADDKYKQRNQR